MVNIAQDLPPKNHNNPPPLDPMEELSESLALRHVSLVRESEDCVSISQRIPQEFKDEIEANFTADFVKRASECQKQLESERVEEKEPFLRKGKLVDRFFKDIIDSLQGAINRAQFPLGNWIQRAAIEEQKRREAEAAELKKLALDAVKDIAQEQTQESVERAVDIQHAAAVAEKVAAVPVQTMASVQTKSSRAGIKMKWVGEVKNISSLDLEKIRPYLSIQHLQVAVNAAVRAGIREIDGVFIHEVADVVVK